MQLPPRDTGVPAILKLLIDVVGFYDGDTRFLLVRARLRDSFVGIEGFVKLDLAGELLVAAQFGPKPAFVLSAGGFHPRYVDLPERVPRDLDKLRVSFKLGPVSLSIEHYFAVTPNSVQAGPEDVVEGRLRRRQDRGVARLGRAAVPVAALLLRRRPRVQGQGEGVRSRRSPPSPSRQRSKAPTSGASTASSASRSCGGTRRFRSTSTSARFARPRPAPPRSARRCRPSSPTPTTSPSRLRPGRTRSR